MGQCGLEEATSVSMSLFSSCDCLAPISPPLSLGLASVCVCHSGTISPGLRAVDILLFNPTRLQFVLGPAASMGEASSARVGGRRPGSVVLLSAWQ